MVVLTTDNLEFLRSMGLANMAVAGDEATPEEARILASMNSILEGKENITDSSVTPNTKPNTPITDQENVVPNPDMADLQAKLQSQQALIDSLRSASQSTTQAGPYDNLSKLQKRMLAFAGIKDAGLALQGKEGTSVSSLLKDFSDRADQERKTLQAQRLASLYSGSGMSVGSMGDLSNMNLEQLQALRDNILSGAFGLNPMTGEALIDPNITKLKLDQVDARIAELQTSQASTEQGVERAEFLMPRINQAMAYLNPNGEIGPDGLPILNPNIATKIARGVSEFKEDPSYQLFKGNLDTIKNTMTFENLLRLKKGGATFGSLSEGELRQIATLAGNLDPSDPLGSLNSLSQIQQKFQEAIDEYNRKLLE
tara:strand:+ start:3030 stop:4136 length:1107 start_codon:yes stop_codon:yes gene_type:complete